MRIGALTRVLWQANNPLLGSPLGSSFTKLQTASPWDLIPRRLPVLASSLLRGGNPSTAAPVLDKGFFFPASTPWVRGFASSKNLKALSSEAPHLSASQLRNHLLWEVLEGPSSELGSSHTHPLSEEEGFASSVQSFFYSGIRHTTSPSSSTEDIRGLSLLAPSYSERADATRGRGLRPLDVPLSPYSRLMATPSSLVRGPALSRLSTTAPRLPTSPGPVSPRSPYSALNGNARALRLGIEAKRRRFPVPQVRYKPGLSKAWRALRLQFCLAWGLPWLRQRRFTNYVSQLTHVAGINFLSMCTNSVGALVRAAGLAGASQTLGEQAFVNGKRVVNPLFQLYKGDRVSLIKAPVAKFARWQRSTEVLITPPLRGWEVDGLTKAVSVFYEATLSELTALHLTKPLPFLTFRMYNWKYRH